MKNIKNRSIKAGVMICILLGVFITNAQATNLEINKVLTTKPANKPWTTLYYIDNDYDGGFTDPLQQIFIDEINSSDRVNVVVIQDKLDEPAYMYYIDENHNITVLEELGEVNMADWVILKDFIAYGKQNYPADRYLLWVYDHGGAWKGACLDETNNHNAIGIQMDGYQKALSETGGVDIIVFLACLMSSIEAVYELRDLVDFVVGSEDLAYCSWFDGICGRANELLTNPSILTTEEVAIKIVDFFPEQNNPPQNKLTMSAIKADKISNLANTLSDLIKYYCQHWLRNYNIVKKAFDNTFLLSDLDEWAKVFEVYDLKDFIEELPPCTKREAVLNAFDEAVIKEVHGTDMVETNGLSIFFQPRASPYRLFRGYTNKNLGLDFPKDTYWNEFLFRFIITNILLSK
jgi:hypothetical protein